MLWKSPIMKVGDTPAPVDVDLTRVKKLALWLRNGDLPGMGGDGPGDWANPTITCNDEVLEVNQDPLGRMASCIATRGETKVYAKEMADESLAVGLFNLADDTVPVSTTWSELKLKGPQRVRDLWRQTNLGQQADGFSAEIPRHGCMVIRVAPVK